MRDCNDCKYLNVTEAEQKELEKAGIIQIHICRKFGKHVNHRAINKWHGKRIYPCSECEENNKRGEECG